MATIRWRPQVNALTKPQSYRIQYVPRNTADYDDMAADISSSHPNYSMNLIRSLAPLMMEWIQRRLSGGDQVTLQDAFNFRLSFSGRLDSPNDPLPEDKDLLHIRVRPSRPFVRKIRHQARLEHLPMNEKLPLITSSEDTKSKLADVLNPAGVLRLTGSNLYFDEEDPNCSCIIQGTQSGQTKQNTYALISNREILLVPDIPAQDNPWNNEYQVSLTTRYTEHGIPRTGIYRRRLRTPLTVPGLGNANPPETGILTGSNALPYVGINSGTVSADTRLRIQVVQNLAEERLLFSLIDMRTQGAAGEEVEVRRNGEYILPGFSSSAVSRLGIIVNEHKALWEMIRNDYGGRLVDILDVRMQGTGDAVRKQRAIKECEVLTDPEWIRQAA